MYGIRWRNELQAIVWILREWYNDLKEKNSMKLGFVQILIKN